MTITVKSMHLVSRELCTHWRYCTSNTQPYMGSMFNISPT